MWKDRSDLEIALSLDYDDFLVAKNLTYKPASKPASKKNASKPASKFGGGFYLEVDWRRVLFLEAGFD
jgi:hypothetical protein